METLLSDDYREEHYHDASEHGLTWVLVNEMLHLIVLGYTLFGMIRFKVKFIHMVKLVNIISFVTIFHSWYLTLKFALIATVMYFFCIELDRLKISFSDFNCSLSGDNVLTEALKLENRVANREAASELPSEIQGTSGDSFTSDEATFIELLRAHYPLMLAEFLNLFGGPLKLLGKRATLMYGFYSIAIFIMLAIFPIELYYQNVGFNFIRFVLNDINCMKDLYEKKRKHLDRLNNWSRNKNTSLLTLSTKKTISQHILRSTQVFEFSLRGRDQLYSIESSPAPNDRSCLGKIATPIKSLRHSLSTNHLDQPCYNVVIANKNLKKFKPHVRSESWFKIAMVIYPIFIFFYFSTLIIVIGATLLFYIQNLKEINDTCTSQVDRTIDLFSNWTFLDRLTFHETHYTVFALSCASSFYCSYYFGTIFELHVWLEEISQQLNLSRILLDLNGHGYALRSAVPPSKDSPYRNYITREVDPAFEGYYNFKDQDVDENYNQFGGLNGARSHIAFKFSPQSKRFKLREFMALKLVSKKQTVLRATYINLCLFFDELNDTRFMTKTILGRTTQIAFGFALMASITRSQFEYNYKYLTILLAACLAILNLYLICAASINSRINKLLPQIHSVISGLTIAERDNDLLEFWLRHIMAYGTDKDAMSYKIYGYKITWSSILNFNGAVSSAYLLTVY